MEFMENKKPSSVQIQVVEAIGILMRVPMRAGKSRFKAPSPTNYDATLDLLAADFSDVVATVAGYAASEVPNDIARDMYAKTLEPGFEYENAALFAEGGNNLMLRDLFNSLVLIIQNLQNDPYRIPVKERNVLVLMDGSRSSYAVLDLGMHIYGHGLCKFGVLKIRDGLTVEDEVLENHLPADVLRRCVQQYQLEDHCFDVQQLVAESIVDSVDLVRTAMKECGSTTLVMGVDVNTSTDRGHLREVLRWAAWEKDELTLVLAKSCSATRPFTSLSFPRTFLVCAKGKDDLPALFQSAVAFMNHDDFIVLHCMSERRDPVGDAKHTRFGLGQKAGCWAQTEEDAATERTALSSSSVGCSSAVYPGWNDAYNEELRREMESILAQAQVTGRVRIDYRKPEQGCGQQIMDCIFEEKADLVVVQRRADVDTSLELVNEAQCAVVLC